MGISESKVYINQIIQNWGKGNFFFGLQYNIGSNESVALTTEFIGQHYQPEIEKNNKYETIRVDKIIST